MREIQSCAIIIWVSLVTTTIGNSITANLLNNISSIASGHLPNTISAPRSDPSLSNDYELDEEPGPSSAQSYTSTRVKQEVPEHSEFDDVQVYHRQFD